MDYFNVVGPTYKELREIAIEALEYYFTAPAHIRTLRFSARNISHIDKEADVAEYKKIIIKSIEMVKFK